MMRQLPRLRVLAYAVLALFSASWVAQAQSPAATKAATRTAKVSTDLLTIINDKGIAQQTPAFGGIQRLNLFMTEGNSIAITAVANSEQEGEALLQSLQALGLTKGRVLKQQVSGFLPTDKLDDLKNVSVLRFARPSYKPIHNVGAVTSQGDVAMRSDVARATYSVDGTGVKIGVISDSYDNLGGAAAGVISGDLPTNVQVLKDLSDGTGSDEGRAMIELIHDVAPGSPQAFYTAFEGYLDFAAGIRALAAAGCKVITDDISYFAEPFFQDGPIAQAVDDVVSNSGVTYFSSAGNSARQSYQNTYRATTQPASPGYYVGAHDFLGGDKFQSITIGAGQQIIIAFQWDDPFFSVSGGNGARTDMDLLVYFNGVFQQDFSSQNPNIGDDPFEIIGLVNNSSSPGVIELALVKYEDEGTGATPDPTLIKWVNFASNVATEYDTKSSTVVGHSNSSLCIAVGAAPFYNTPAFNNALTTATIEPFSSAGGTPILFNVDGARLGAPLVRQKPEITSVDGTNTTFFGFDTNRDPDTFPNFFGTSAAAPHAAGVAALMVSKVPSITRNTILSTLQSTALDMDDPSTPGFDTGFDFGTGYGFIQADKALQAISPIDPPFAITGVMTVSCSPVLGNANQRSLTFTPQYSGVNGQPIAFSIANETLPTTTPGPYTILVYTDNPSLTLRASQQGTSGQVSFVYNWLAVCGSNPTNTAPTVANAIPDLTATVGTAFSYVIPGNTFTDTETPNQLTLSVSGLPAGLMFSAPATISGTPTASGTSSVTVTATDPGALSASTTFNLTVNPAPVDPTDPFAITGVTTVSCSPVLGNANQRSLTFTPQYSGTNGQPITFSVDNETLPTTAPGPYTLLVYTDNSSLTLRASQPGTSGQVSFVYNWLAACGSGNTRIGAVESDSNFQVILLGNPVADGRLSVLVRGVSNQPVTMSLIDIRGKALGSHQIERAGLEEQHVFEVGRQPIGLLLLKVSTPSETKTVKVLKAQ